MIRERTLALEVAREKPGPALFAGAPVPAPVTREEASFDGRA